jgi:NAD(P)-dependent dehydrogenase (short-subunit alcohol dehydrogenase family)
MKEGLLPRRLAGKANARRAASNGEETSMKLQNKVAIVTGGASGIGEATVRDFVREGAKVVIADVSPTGARLSQELNDGGASTVFIQTDVSDETQTIAMVAHAVSHFGRLDIMVANAGVGSPGVPVAEMSVERWQRTIGINLTGVFLSNKHAIAQMQQQGDGGVVVNVASVLGHVGAPGLADYTASKGGVANLTRTLAIAHAREGIRINAVCPGFVDTPIYDGVSEAQRRRIIAAHPIGRMGRVEEIAATIRFLASDDASFVVGANLLVDGGYTAQ